MSDAHLDLVDYLADLTDDANKRHPFYLFEPWDPGVRDESIYEQAKKDNVYDAITNETFKGIISPGKFQTGFLLSNAFMRVNLGGTQIGKSISAYIEMIIILTGEIPFALRYKKGVDTGILREIEADNIRRFGRFSLDGEFLDHNVKYKRDGKWNCGTIKGVGVFPKEKIAPPGHVVWVGTYLKALEQYWWPRFEGGKRMFPDEFIDKSRGRDGFSKKEQAIFFPQGRKLSFITYETGYNRFEAEKAWMVYLDEEPDDERIVPAAQSHTHKGFALIETPYRGLTYTQPLIYRKGSASEKEVFHACQYDSPYQTEDLIHNTRVNLKPWEIEARVWGLHSEVRGRPFYDRQKLAAWRRKYPRHFDLAEILPTRSYTSIETESVGSPGLLDIDCHMVMAEYDNDQTCWNIYEKPEDNVGYVLTADPAEGAANPEDAQDKCAALISRLPKEGEGDEPIICASIRSTLETVEFSKMCMVACQYYNGALIAAESRRAAANATFYITARDWPYWYKMVKVGKSSMETTDSDGFDTNSKTRPMLFDMIGEYIKTHDAGSYPKIPDEALLKELEACMVGRNGRPDHPKGGTLDTAICFGILLYVNKFSPWQVQCNRMNDESQPVSSWRERFSKQTEEAPAWLGGVSTTFR